MGLGYHFGGPDIDVDLPGHKPFWTFRDSDNQGIEGDALSTGEKVMLTLYDHLEKHVTGPNILLIDDVDSFLHPPLVRILAESLSRTLPQSGSVAFIVTQSAVTAQLFEQADYFWKEGYSAPIITATKAELISKLSYNQFVVADNTVTVFVEGQDHTTWNAVLERMVRRGKVKPQRSANFVSPRTNPDSGDAGKSAVNEIVAVMRRNGFERQFVGLIDKDYGNAPGEGVRMLTRYSIENYWFDPLNIYCYLLDRAYSKLPAGLQFSSLMQGDSKLLVEQLTQAELQSIVSHYGSEMARLCQEKGIFPGCDWTATETVVIHGGPTLTYPSFLLQRRGKDLKPIAVEFDKALNAKSLNDKFTEGAFWPQDLVDLMQDLSTP